MAERPTREDGLGSGPGVPVPAAVHPDSVTARFGA